MSQSPAKRRKLSPEPRLNATPTADRYPSFASPTRSSIARVAPQLLERRSMENDAPIQRTGALARTPPGAQPSLFVTQSSQGASQDQNTPLRPLRRSPRSGGLRGGMASAPRRPSRSPQKAPPTPRAPDIFDEPPPDPIAPIDLGLADPFQKRPALRRSPPPGAAPAAAQGAAPVAPEPQIDPFRRGGLRRSGGGVAAPVVQGVPAAAPESDIANPFEKRGLRRSDARAVSESMVAMPPPLLPTQPRPQTERQEERPAQQTLAALPIQPRQQPRAQEAQPNPQVQSVPRPLPPAAPSAEAIAASDGRAALRNQRLRGAQTRSPGQVDFGFNIPAAAPRPIPVASLPAPAPIPAVGIKPVVAASQISIPAPFVESSAPTPTPPTHPNASQVDSPLFVSQTTKSPLPNIDSSILSTHTPTPAPLSRTSVAAEKEPERARHRVSEAAQEEPTLPPTPTQRGMADPVVTTPPTGIHNTPSKRLKRRTVHQSSPLKPRGERRSQPSDEMEAEPETEPANKRQRAADPPSRFSQPLDPNAEKKKKRERMLAEIRQLESDIRLAERENECIRKAAAAGKDPKRPANADPLVDLLSRTMAHPPTFESPRKQPISVLDNVSLFLPFSRPAKPPSKPTAELVKTADLPSVLPVEVDNPLPFLSVFTPFKFRSSITTLPPTPGHETGEADIIQLHSITTSAPHCLFSSRVGLTVNTRSGAVEGCEIEYLDPCADRELGVWARKRIGRGVWGRDVNSVFWASSQWYESALTRARFWCQVETELATREGRERARRRIRSEARRGRRPQPGEPAEPEEHFEEWEERKFTPEQLRRHMGRQAMEIEVEGVKLGIRWRICFDWTGEAEQSVTAAVKVPGRCKEP